MLDWLVSVHLFSCVTDAVMFICL